MINKVSLIGRLGNDPDVRYTQKGAVIANVSLATSEKWNDKQTGEKKEHTEWHRLVFFNRLGEIVSEYLKKGALIYIEGKLRTEKWQDKNGNDQYTTKIYVSELKMLLSQQNNNQQQQQQRQQQQSHNQPPQQQYNNSGFDDDIPF